MQKPLLEHLIELRIRLIYSLLALIASMAVCYPFASPLFQFLTAPLWHAMGEEEGRSRGAGNPTAIGPERPSVRCAQGHRTNDSRDGASEG